MNGKNDENRTFWVAYRWVMNIVISTSRRDRLFWVPGGNRSNMGRVATEGG